MSKQGVKPRFLLQGEDIATTQNFVKDTVPPTGKPSQGLSARFCTARAQKSPVHVHLCLLVLSCARPCMPAVAPARSSCLSHQTLPSPAVVFTRAGSAINPLSLNAGQTAPSSTPDATALFEFSGTDTSGVNFTCTVSAK